MSERDKNRESERERKRNILNTKYLYDDDMKEVMKNNPNNPH